MYWRQDFVDELTANLLRLGAQACPSCGNEDLQAVNPMPFVATLGQMVPSPVGETDEQRSPGFFAIVECHSCGSARFFNVARHGGPTTPMFTTDEDGGS